MNHKKDKEKEKAMLHRHATARIRCGARQEQNRALAGGRPHTGREIRGLGGDSPPLRRVGGNSARRGHKRHVNAPGLWRVTRAALVAGSEASLGWVRWCVDLGAWAACGGIHAMQGIHTSWSVSVLGIQYWTGGKTRLAWLRLALHPSLQEQEQATPITGFPPQTGARRPRTAA